jgi:hypothetical protein
VIVDLEALPVQAKFLALSSLRRITDGDVQRGKELEDRASSEININKRSDTAWLQKDG